MTEIGSRAAKAAILFNCGCRIQLVIIIIIDSMTSVFNTGASVPYNHDLFESLIVKKRVKVHGEGTQC
ncbi:hypothetical protein T265_03914 [Opisthorchis viverrini]|uniref:Uncharacterized protein n=1 Tax=Opisthorchis viverrini TaxID=6198 RepID=A0A074ZPU9_OPIVI|nr:hypothetical protein T265_03914 [Opisthorchis viverrini]KER29448.1 hypothetical protein T265_03914 [Opisthorchis viverrini]